MGVKSVNALVERYEAARRAAKSSDGAAGSHEVPGVVEGSVQELIDLYNGMARSLPDFPRSAYSRSTRRPALAPAQSLVVHDDDEEQQQDEPQDTEEQQMEKAGEDDGEEEEGEEEELRDAEHKRMENDAEQEGDDDDDEEDEMSTCDETASINSLSSSFMSDCSYDDHASEASLYYESEYQLHQQTVDPEPEEEHQPVDPRAEPTCDCLPVEAEGELVACLSPLTPVEVAQPTHAESLSAPEPAHDAALPTITTETALAKQDQTECLPKLPRALLSSGIPIRRGSTISGANKKAIKPVPATVSGGLETSRPSGAIGRPVAAQSQRERCDPSVPRSPVKKDVCRRFAAANSPSPREQEETKRSERRRFISDFNKPRTPAAAAAAPTAMAMTKKRASATASSARFQGSKAPTSSFVDTTIAPAQSAPTKFMLTARHSPLVNNSRATRSHSAPTRPREIQARPSTPPLSAPLPALQNAEIQLDRIKSRLFDYENDPKRLEMVAANRARRKSLEARPLQAARSLHARRGDSLQSTARTLPPQWRLARAVVTHQVRERSGGASRGVITGQRNEEDVGNEEEANEQALASTPAALAERLISQRASMRRETSPRTSFQPMIPTQRRRIWRPQKVTWIMTSVKTMAANLKREVDFDRLYVRTTGRAAQREIRAEEKREELRFYNRAPQEQSNASERAAAPLGSVSLCMWLLRMKAPEVGSTDEHVVTTTKHNKEKGGGDSLFRTQDDEELHKTDAQLQVLEHARRLKLRRNLRSLSWLLKAPHCDSCVLLTSSSSARVGRDLRLQYARVRAALRLANRQRRPAMNKMQAALRSLHLEAIAAKLYDRSRDLRENIVEVRDRAQVLGDLCFFARPAFQSKIAYDRTANAVPLPPTASPQQQQGTAKGNGEASA